MHNTPLEFTGTFDDKHRDRLRWLLRVGHMKPKDLARLINCSDSACRLWINGKNVRCQTHFIPAFQIIFSGELNPLFKEAGKAGRKPSAPKTATEDMRITQHAPAEDTEDTPSHSLDTTL